MDKSFGTLYHKISSLFHPNSSNSPASDLSASLPVTHFLDRVVPKATSSPPINQHRSSSRISRQISIKTTDQQPMFRADGLHQARYAFLLCTGIQLTSSISSQMSNNLFRIKEIIAFAFSPTSERAVCLKLHAYHFRFRLRTITRPSGGDV